MKSTGIIRRIDDLGRVVIPKEIRKSFKISEGDPVEIYVEDNDIVLRRYDSLRTLKKEANALAISLAKAMDVSILVSDLKEIVAFGNTQRLEYMGRSVSEKLEQIMKQRDIYSTKQNSCVKILEEDEVEKYISQVIVPIVTDTYVVGSIIVFSDKKGRVITEGEIKEIILAKSFIENIVD